MSHPLVLGLFEDATAAATGARAAHALGISGDQLSVVASDHDEEGAIARVIDASPGAEIEDSRTAGRLGELGGYVLAAVAVVLPGVGPILAAGPLGAELGEAAGHVAGGLAAVLRDGGVDEARAVRWQDRVEAGAVLLGAHAVGTDPASVEDAFVRAGALDTALATWE